MYFKYVFQIIVLQLLHNPVNGEQTGVMAPSTMPKVTERMLIYDSCCKKSHSIKLFKASQSFSAGYMPQSPVGAYNAPRPLVIPTPSSLASQLSYFARSTCECVSTWNAWYGVCCPATCCSVFNTLLGRSAAARLITAGSTLCTFNGVSLIAVASRPPGVLPAGVPTHTD